MSGGVGAQDVREHHGVEVVGLLAGDGVSVSVAGGGHGVDGVDRAAGGPQGGDEQTTGGLDSDGDGVVGTVAVGGEHLQQLGEALGCVVDPAPGE